MSDELKLNKPWLVAVWPGMGQVAVNAGYYMMAKLKMRLVAEFSSRELFDVEHVDVADGLIQQERLPRSRFYVGTDPTWKHDIVLFIGEAQPSQGKFAFCQRLLEYAKGLGVERVFTFASMATPMHPDHDSRVFAIATHAPVLQELRALELEVLNSGQIGGLNGVLLGAAADGGLEGACLLGEIPQIFARFPFPKASWRVLEAFTTMAGIDLPLDELRAQSKAVEDKLGELLGRIEDAMKQQGPDHDESEESFTSLEPEGLSAADHRKIEKLFAKAQHDRSQAYVLKQELDRLEVFTDYEDRFLDLFKPTDQAGPSEAA